MEQKVSLRSWLQMYNGGVYENPDRKVQIGAGWYDWFCYDKSLRNKTRRFGKILNHIKNDYILDNYYVWFKNNCPFGYPLYDDIRFEPLNEKLRESEYFVISLEERDYRHDGRYKCYTARKNYDFEFGVNSVRELSAKIDELGEQFKKLKNI